MHLMLVVYAQNALFFYAQLECEIKGSKQSTFWKGEKHSKPLGKICRKMFAKIFAISACFM